MEPATQSAERKSNGTALEVLAAFTKLGLTSFGGPIAHLGYFRDEFVTRRKWLSDAAYADLVALCQFLPGPASSQVGFGLGLMRGGALGAFFAWLAFTLPSALLLIAFAYGAAAFDGPTGNALLHGLKLVAVAVIAQAVWGMAKSLCPDKPRAGIAVAAALIVIFFASSLGQVSAIIAGALAGLLFFGRNAQIQPAESLHFPVSKLVGGASFFLFLLLLLGLPFILQSVKSAELTLFDSFYRAGALVFGGGHVVLPLLEAETVSRGWVGADEFLAGYGVAQAVPGPLFTFAAYLGGVMKSAPTGLAGATIALLAIFLPGFLLLIAALPFWNALRARPMVQAAMMGANAAVVGLLGAALYNPVWTSAVFSPYDFALALVGFTLLTVWKAPPWIVVILLAVGAIVLSLI